MHPSDCHPDRPTLALGLCGACYQRHKSIPYKDLSEEKKEKSRAANRKSYRKRKNKHPEQLLEKEHKRVLRQHGINIEDYTKLGNSQEWKCAICGRPHGDSRATRLQIDHDHSCCPRTFSCGKCIRGLLCINCNLALGALKDNPDLIAKLLIYLSRGKDKQSG